MLGNTIVNKDNPNFNLSEKVIELQGDTSKILYKFRRINLYKASGKKDIIDNFNKTLDNYCKEIKEIEIPKESKWLKVFILLENKFQTLPKEEQDAFKGRILHEYGCEMEFEESKGDETTLKIKGYMTNEAYTLYSKHPLCQVDFKVSSGIYPSYWSNIKDTKTNETQGKISYRAYKIKLII